jgi:hypothetical protein
LQRLEREGAVVGGGAGDDDGDRDRAAEDNSDDDAKAALRERAVDVVVLAPRQPRARKRL